MATDTSAPLPDLTLEEKSQLVVDTGDVGAIITRIVIHFSQDVPEADVKPEKVGPLLAYVPQEDGA